MLVVHCGALMPHPPPPPDPQTVLLIHPDSVLGIIDQSAYAHPLTVSVVTHDGTNPSPSQSESMANASTNSGDVTANSSIDFSRAANEPFTIEFSIWIEPEVAAPTQMYFMGWDSGHYHTATALGGNLFRLTYTDGSNHPYGDIAGGEWHQLAIAYDGSYFRTFLNGVMVAEDGPGAVAIALPGAQEFGVFKLPQRVDLARLAGRLAEVRLTMGLARYTANYTPATTPFPNPSAP